MNADRIGKARPRRRRPRLAITGVLICAVVVLLGITISKVEQVIRKDPRLLPPAWQVKRVAKQGVHEFVPDSELGFLFPPNMSRLIQTDDFTIVRTSDSLGFPNKNPRSESADIVFLGDSLLSGEGVGIERHFVSLISEMLPNDTIVNLGIPGAGAERQYRIYRRYGVVLHPRLVVAGLYLVADLQNDVLFNKWLRSSEGMEYDEFRLGFARRHESQDLKSRLARRLRRMGTLSWIQSVVEPRLWGSYEIMHGLRVVDGTEFFFDRDKIRFAREVVTNSDIRLQQLFTSLGRLRTLAQGHGTSLVVMLIPSKEEIFAVQGQQGAHNAVARVRQRLSEEQIPYLDLYPVLRKHGTDRAPYFSRDIHLNAKGNQVVAEAFVAWMRSDMSAQLD